MTDRTLWDKCVAFHGHRCPGLAIGVRAAEVALDFFIDDITGGDDPGITCTCSTSKCPSDGLRCVLNVDDGRGLTIAEEEGELRFDFAKNGKHIILTALPGKRGMSAEERIVSTLMGKVQDIFGIQTIF